MFVPCFPLFPGRQKTIILAVGGKEATSEWWISFHKARMPVATSVEMEIDCRSLLGTGCGLAESTEGWVRWESSPGVTLRTWICKWVARSACDVSSLQGQAVFQPSFSSVSPPQPWDRGSWAAQWPWAGLCALKSCRASYVWNSL